MATSPRIAPLSATAHRHDALALLAEAWHARLLAHAASLLKNPEEAQDVIQEVFIRAMKEERIFEPDFKVQAWLYTVTRNLCFNLLRDRKRRSALLAREPAQELQLPTRAHDPFEARAEEEAQVEMTTALNALSGDHRDILYLRYYQDLSYGEIADTLSLKLGTVMSRLSRARDRLHDVLAEGEVSPSARAA